MRPRLLSIQAVRNDFGADFYTCPHLDFLHFGLWPPTNNGLDKTLWAIANRLRGAITVDDFHMSRTSRSNAPEGPLRHQAPVPKTHADKNNKLCEIIKKISKSLKEVSTDFDTLGDAYEYFIGQFAAGSGKKTDYNLNISRYVSTAEPEPEIDLTAPHQPLTALEQRVQEARQRHNAFLRELGLPELP